MEKKKYIQPKTETAYIQLEDVMITASPGVEGEYDPNKPIDAKQGFLLDVEEDAWRNPDGWNLEEE